ncbi:MAG: hypothetical protein ACRDZY_00980 [Acidimicrobiales bacterium]
MLLEKKNAISYGASGAIGSEVAHAFARRELGVVRVSYGRRFYRPAMAGVKTTVQELLADRRDQHLHHHK